MCNKVVCAPIKAIQPAFITVYHIAYTIRTSSGLYRRVSNNYDTLEDRSRSYHKLKASKRISKISLWQTKYNIQDINGGQ